MSFDSVIKTMEHLEQQFVEQFGLRAKIEVHIHSYKHATEEEIQDLFAHIIAKNVDENIAAIVRPGGFHSYEIALNNTSMYSRSRIIVYGHKREVDSECQISDEEE